MISKCLFPAAGYGTRFLPATKAVPKEMLPILTKPLLQYGVEEALSAGISNMAIVTGRGKRAIEDHFDNSFELESQLLGTSKESYIKEIKKIEPNQYFYPNSDIHITVMSIISCYDGFDMTKIDFEYKLNHKQFNSNDFPKKLCSADIVLPKFLKVGVFIKIMRRIRKMRYFSEGD